MGENSGPITCHNAREGLTEYLENALPPTRRQGIDEHLGSCAECRRVLMELTTTIQRLRALSPEPMPAEMKQSLLQAFRERQSG
jgi:anti-sigma factor RsiW